MLRTTSWDSTAWVLANLYLLNAGAEPLSDEAPRIVVLSEGTTCFVTMSYFEPDAPLADFLVHEAAHVFHNCKPRRLACLLHRTASGCSRSLSPGGRRSRAPI